MTPAEIAATLPPGKTYDEALRRAVNYRNALWNDPWSGTEDERIDELDAYCMRLCQGNAEAGRALATDSCWEPS